MVTLPTMSRPRATFYFHVTDLGIERHPFSGLTIDQLKPMVGDRSGQCHLGLTYRYFPNPVFLIANDDDYGNRFWPVTAIINRCHFRGAFVILAERTVDPHSRPLWGDTFWDGLTAKECEKALSFIAPPPGFSLHYRVVP